ncbi:MAG: MCE family protein [Verrucomicrobia bacterium]|nr:MCE family protein [Verrucomicrobiota bacterium]
MQDLTPQLRTRLGRVERAVGFFVGFATLLLAAGFCYYVYNTAQRKGWFDTKVRYYTYLRSGVGLKPKETVKLMGFDAGEITDIKPMPPESGYEVYVEFVLRHPNEGYIWTEGSHINVSSSGVFGSRFLEVTKGTNGYPTYAFNDMREMPLAELAATFSDNSFAFAQDYFDAATNRITETTKPVGTNQLASLRAANVKSVKVFNQRTQSRLPTFMWYDAPYYEPTAASGYYVPYVHGGPKPSKYYLNAREAAVLSEVIEDVTKRVKDALPAILAMTNQLSGVLNNSQTLLSNVNHFINEARPLTIQASNLLAGVQPTVQNVGRITSNLTNAHGALGEWIITASLKKQINDTLASARATLGSITNTANSATNTMSNVNVAIGDARTLMQHTDTNIAYTIFELSRTLDNLAGITANLHKQVEANTNIVSEISASIVHADELLQGLKRHWLLRSAFKTNAPPKSPSPPSKSNQPGLPPRKN